MKKSQNISVWLSKNAFFDQQDAKADKRHHQSLNLLVIG
jgi:hypothetical protein